MRNAKHQQINTCVIPITRPTWGNGSSRKSPSTKVKADSLTCLWYATLASDLEVNLNKKTALQRDNVSNMIQQLQQEAQQDSSTMWATWSNNYNNKHNLDFMTWAKIIPVQQLVKELWTTTASETVIAEVGNELQSQRSHHQEWQQWAKRLGTPRTRRQWNTLSMTTSQKIWRLTICLED